MTSPLICTYSLLDELKKRATERCDLGVLMDLKLLLNSNANYLVKSCLFTPPVISRLTSELTSTIILILHLARSKFT